MANVLSHNPLSEFLFGMGVRIPIATLSFGGQGGGAASSLGWAGLFFNSWASVWEAKFFSRQVAGFGV